jgi:hypothetical protein
MGPKGMYLGYYRCIVACIYNLQDGPQTGEPSSNNDAVMTV